MKHIMHLSFAGSGNGLAINWGLLSHMHIKQDLGRNKILFVRSPFG